MRQGILLGNFLCDRVQGVERFATHTRHFPSQVPPPHLCCALDKEASKIAYFVVKRGIKSHQTEGRVDFKFKAYLFKSDCRLSERHIWYCWKWESLLEDNCKEW